MKSFFFFSQNNFLLAHVKFSYHDHTNCTIIVSLAVLSYCSHTRGWAVTGEYQSKYSWKNDSLSKQQLLLTFIQQLFLIHRVPQDLFFLKAWKRQFECCAIFSLPSGWFHLETKNLYSHIQYNLVKAPWDQLQLWTSALCKSVQVFDGGGNQSIREHKGSANSTQKQEMQPPGLLAAQKWNKTSWLAELWSTRVIRRIHWWIFSFHSMQAMVAEQTHILHSLYVWPYP